MNTVLLIIGTFFLGMAALATPIAIGLGLYDWVGNDMEFKFALWNAFKLWVAMVVSGLVVGLPCAGYAR